jgi:transcription initiation factor TFIIIB Brf1 subunit/transcription initiation factor TFIIB
MININDDSGEMFNIEDIDNYDDLNSLDDLDNLDCGKYFQNIYDNIIKDCDNIATNKSKCSRCDSSEFIEDHTNGIIICSCGEVINNLYDSSPDVRSYDDDNKQDNKRFNKVTNELLPQSSLGAKLPNNIKGNLKKLQNWGAMPYRERSLYNDFKIINEKCENLGLSKNIQQSSNIFYAAAKSCKHPDGENIGKHIITRGKNNKGIQGGSIWISCKKNNTPICTKDIADQFNLTIKELNKGIKSLKKLLKIKNMSVQLNVIGSEQYVKKYCTEMNIKEYYMEQAIKIAKNIDRLNIITEHTQFSIAATSVLIMAELNSITNMTKKSLRSMFGVSNVTISKTYKKLEKIKHILIDDLKVDKLIKKINKLNDEQELSEDIKKRMKLFGIKCEEDDTNNIIINKQIDNNIIDNNIGYADNIILIKNVKNYKSDDTNLKSSEKPKKKNKTLNILSK